MTPAPPNGLTAALVASSATRFERGVPLTASKRPPRIHGRAGVQQRVHDAVDARGPRRVDRAVGQHVGEARAGNAADRREVAADVPATGAVDCDRVDAAVDLWAARAQVAGRRVDDAEVAHGGTDPGEVAAEVRGRPVHHDGVDRAVRYAAERRRGGRRCCRRDRGWRGPEGDRGESHDDRRCRARGAAAGPHVRPQPGRRPGFP